MSVRCDARMKNGQDFMTRPQGAKLHLQWTYPSQSEIETLRPKLRVLLFNPEHSFTHSTKLSSLVIIPEVTSALTVDELLDALKGRIDSVDGRNLVVGIIGQRFSADPKVVAYYSERLWAEDHLALFDIEADPQLWHPSWIPPLVANFEKTGNDDALRTLGYHRTDWLTSEQDVSRLSAALLRHYPILSQDTSSLTADKLNQWKEVATQAGIVGDKALVRVLAPDLDDKRIIPNPLNQAITPPENRVCDWALLAILTILDGSQGASLKQADTNTWERNPQTRYSTFDREIASTKKRIK